MGKTHRQGVAGLAVVERHAKQRARSVLVEVLAESAMSNTDVAKLIGRSKPFVTHILADDYNITVKTMARVFAACGYELGFTATKMEPRENV